MTFTLAIVGNFHSMLEAFLDVFSSRESEFGKLFISLPAIYAAKCGRWFSCLLGLIGSLCGYTLFC